MEGIEHNARYVAERERRGIQLWNRFQTFAFAPLFGSPYTRRGQLMEKIDGIVLSPSLINVRKGRQHRHPAAVLHFRNGLGPRRSGRFLQPPA
jgi:hypothetical protein